MSAAPLLPLHANLTLSRAFEGIFEGFCVGSWDEIELGDASGGFTAIQLAISDPK